MKDIINKCMKIIVLEVITVIVVCFCNTIISLSANSNDKKQTIEDGVYVIKSSINQKYVLDILRGIKE